MKRIYEILGLTPGQYELGVFNNYLEWCESVAMDVIEIQKIISDAPISRWYATEYKKCEAEFLNRVKNYTESETVTQEDKETLYTDCTFRMMNLSPKALVAAAKNKDKIQTKIPVPGIKIFSYN